MQSFISKSLFSRRPDAAVVNEKIPAILAKLANINLFYIFKLNWLKNIFL
jgi:hypothetical protein